jgi:hypothetical protein
MIPVHLRIYGDTACGIDSFGEGEMRSSVHKAVVTCEACKASVLYGQTVQRIPVMPPRPGWTPVPKVRE